MALGWPLVSLHQKNTGLITRAEVPLEYISTNQGFESSPTQIKLSGRVWCVQDYRSILNRVNSPRKRGSGVDSSPRPPF